MKSLLLLFAFIFAVSSNLLSQGMISIAPFDKYGKLPSKDIQPISDEEKEQLALIKSEIGKMDKGNNLNYYKSSIDRINGLLNDPDDPLNSYGKMLAFSLLKDIYLTHIISDDTCIYNSEKYSDEHEYDFYPTYDEESENNRIYALKLTKGMQVLNGFIDSAMFYADEERLTYFSKLRVQLMENTGYREIMNFEYHPPVEEEDEFDENWLHDLYNLDKQIKEMVVTKESGPAKIQLNKLLDAHRETNFNPFTGYINLGLGATSMFGKEAWFGGEFTVGYGSNKNLFLFFEPLTGEPNSNINFIKLNYQQSLNSDKKDYSFSIFNGAKIHLLSMNIAQFGWQTGSNFGDKARWFYRPEVGITYGCFTLRYGYNLMFNKSIRGFTEKNILTFKISYPLVRLGNYQ
jgi:hypothetical protein